MATWTRLGGTAALLLALTALVGCGVGGGSGGDDADDVPTITTQPSVTTSPTASSATPETSATAPATTEATSEATTEATGGETTDGSTDQAPTSAPPPDRAAGPTSYEDAIDRINATATQGPTVFATRFVTRTDGSGGRGDDVYCLLDDPVIGPTCELGNGFINDPDVCGADSTDRVGRIETFEGRPRPVCNADTIREPGAEVVGAPGVVVSGEVTCAAESFGVTCIDRAADAGFFLGKGEYHVFR
ncbi:hypothetical protein [Nocardioides stalactiti]|uniref:hypothetical protein n=1 Tax=Nocardioides stalactiti TaxID=2755356 RepID=UPI001602A670|nr:hypothetical protein [Nocardioides stalactiti]